MKPEPDLSAPRLGGDLQRFAQGAGVQLSGKLVGRATSFLTQLFLARWLGPARLGTYAIGLSLFLIASLTASLGLEHGVIRFASRYRKDDPERVRAVLRKALLFTLVFGLLGGALLFVAARPLALDVYRIPELSPILSLLALGVVFGALLRVAAAGTRVGQRMQHSVLTEDFGQPVLFLILALGLWAMGSGLLAVVAALVVSYAGASLAALFLLDRAQPLRGRCSTDFLPSRELLAFSAATAATSVLGLMGLWIDRLLVGYFRGESDTGIYHSAALISVLFFIVLNSFNAMLSPMVADLYHRGELQRLGRLFRVATKWGLYLCLPLFLLFMLYPEIVLTSIFDDRYLGGIDTMRVLCCGQLVNVATGAVGHLLIMSGNQKSWLGLTGASLIGNVLLNLLWIPRYGLIGAAGATALTGSGLMLAGVWVVRRRLDLWPWDRRFVKGLLAAMVTALVLAGLRWLESGWGLTGLLGLGAVAVIVFLATLAILGFDQEDRFLLRLLRSRRGG